MLILSQEKDAIFNLKNIEVMGIANLLENDKGNFRILIDTVSDTQYPVAEYKTEKRAKEVLQEIIKKYEEYTIVFNEKGMVSNYIQKPKVYEMPKK